MDPPEVLSKANLFPPGPGLKPLSRGHRGSESESWAHGPRSQAVGPHTPAVSFLLGLARPACFPCLMSTRVKETEPDQQVRHRGGCRERLGTGPTIRKSISNRLTALSQHVSAPPPFLVSLLPMLPSESSCFVKKKKRPTSGKYLAPITCSHLVPLSVSPSYNHEVSAPWALPPWPVSLGGEWGLSLSMAAGCLAVCLLTEGRGASLENVGHMDHPTCVLTSARSGSHACAHLWCWPVGRPAELGGELPSARGQLC